MLCCSTIVREHLTVSYPCYRELYTLRMCTPAAHAGFGLMHRDRADLCSSLASLRTGQGHPQSIGGGFWGCWGLCMFYAHLQCRSVSPDRNGWRRAGFQRHFQPRLHAHAPSVCPWCRPERARATSYCPVTCRRRRFLPSTTAAGATTAAHVPRSISRTWLKICCSWFYANSSEVDWP